MENIDGNYTFPYSARVDAVIFVPGAAGDILKVLEGDNAGQLIIHMKSSSGDSLAFYPQGSKMTPYLDYTNSTLSSGATVIFYLR